MAPCESDLTDSDARRRSPCPCRVPHLREELVQRARAMGQAWDKRHHNRLLLSGLPPLACPFRPAPFASSPAVVSVIEDDGDGDGFEEEGAHLTTAAPAPGSTVLCATLRPRRRPRHGWRRVSSWFPTCSPTPFPTTADGDGFEEDAHLRCGDRCRRQISAASALVSRTATPAFSLQTAVQWGDREKRHVRMTCGSHVGPTIFCYFVCETGIWVPRANSQIFVTHNRHNMSCDPCTNSNICVPMLLYSKQDTKFVI